MVLVNADKIKREFLIENSKESREAIRLEKRLLVDLNTILEFIKINFDFKTYDYKFQLDIIKSIIYNQTYSVIRHYYQQSYEIGNTYVNELLLKYPYLTHSDTDIIERQSRDFTNRFFGRLEKVLKKSNEMFMKAIMGIKTYDAVGEFMKQDENGNLIADAESELNFFSKRIEQSESYLFSSLAILIINDALNKATVNKSKELVKQELSGNNRILTAAESKPKRKGKLKLTREELLMLALEEEMERRAEEDREREKRQNTVIGVTSALLTTATLNQLQEETNGIISPDTEQVTTQQLFKNAKERRNIVDVSKMVYEWRTRRDERVCPICSQLDSTKYSGDDVLPEPVDSTHFNCRCRLVLTSGSEINIE